MSLLSTLATYQTPLLVLGTIFGPSLLPYLTRRPWSTSSRSPRPPLPKNIKLLLLLHTICHLFTLLFPPYDIFVTHALPVLTSNTTLRSAVLGQASTYHPSRLDESQPLLELLLTRLQNLDTRYLYVRFGHRPLLTCVWCKDINDFLLASLAGVLTPYVVEAVVIGIMGWGWVGGEEAGRRAERWRGSFGWALGWMVVGEIGARYLWDVRAVDGDSLHLSTTIHTIRAIVLLLLPIIYILLPIPPVSPNWTALLPALSNANSTIRLTSVARTAISRNHGLRHIWALAGEREAGAAKAAREDEVVMRVADEVGVRNDDLRRSGRSWIDLGWKGLVRIQGDHVAP